METFTTRPATQWTAPSTVYDVGVSVNSTRNENIQAQSTAIPYSSNGSGTTNGLSSNANTSGTSYGVSSSQYERTGNFFSQTNLSSFNLSIGISTSGVTTGESATSATSTDGLSFVSLNTENDTSRATFLGTTAQTSYHIINREGTSTSATDSPGSASTTASGTSTTTRTFSGTSTTFSTYSAAVDTSTITTISTNGLNANAFTTSTFSISTTNTSQISSSWNTLYTTLTGQNTTLTSATADITYQQDSSTVLTATTHLRTSYAFGSILQDTVFLMNANRASDDYNMGELLWHFGNSGFATSDSSIGVFSDLYSSSSARTITLLDRSRFFSESAVVTVVPLSIQSTTSSDTITTYTYQTTLTSGLQSTNVLTSTYSTSASLGDVSSYLSTYTQSTTTDTAQPPATISSTTFTHSYQTTGYNTSNSSWTTTTSSSLWGFASSSTFTRTVYFSSVSTTQAQSFRSSTTDEVLISSFTTTGTGTDTVRVFLGSFSTATTRVFSTESTFTRATYPLGLHSSASQYTSTETAASGGTTSFTRLNNFSITKWTEARAYINVSARPGNDNMPGYNEVRHQCHAIGHAGFGGSFAASNLIPYVTTTQGLAAGSTFTEATIQPPATRSACIGVSMIPISSGVTFGGLASAVRTSLLSYPTSIESVISLAVTWSSSTSTTSGTTTTSTITTRAATHTLGLTSSITGTFWTAKSFTVNSNFRTELPDSPASGGFVAGDNALGSTYKLLARAGNIKWTEFSSEQSTSPLTGAASGINGSVSTTIPASHAIVFTLENIITARMSTVANASVFSSTPHIKHEI